MINKLFRTATAPAKLNISLDITHKMDDGYHYLESVMQTVSFGDEITIECLPCASGREKTAVKTNITYIPDDGRNLALKAAEAFLRNTDIKGFSLKIYIDKKIPICAGMGGGSADAACVLRMLNEMLGAGLSRGQLEKIAETIGADVPFCVTGGTKLAVARGESLTDLPAFPQCDIVICKPDFSCSTPELFSRIDCRKIQARPDTQGIIKAIESGNLRGIAQRMYNVFEDFMPRGSDDIDAIKAAMFDSGAIGSVMTGSGPTVFGIFDKPEKAGRAHQRLLKTYKDCILTKTTDAQGQLQH